MLWLQNWNGYQFLLFWNHLPHGCHPASHVKKTTVFNMRQSLLNFEGLQCFLNRSSGIHSWPTVDYNTQTNTELTFKSGPLELQRLSILFQT